MYIHCGDCSPCKFVKFGRRAEQKVVCFEREKRFRRQFQGRHRRWCKLWILQTSLSSGCIKPVQVRLDGTWYLENFFNSHQACAWHVMAINLHEACWEPAAYLLLLSDANASWCRLGDCKVPSLQTSVLWNMFQVWRWEWGEWGSVKWSN